jgi:MFS superfamily sulfate permease-like transporter
VERLKEVLMRIAQAEFSFLVSDLAIWPSDWAWGLPLIVLTVLIHVLGLGLINQRAARVSSGTMARRHPTTMFVVVMGTTTLLATILHGVEAGIWAAAYRLLGALPNNKSAMLYSLSAITSYGHANLFLENHWQLMGAIEALNGWLLFGLTAAFLFGMMERLWLSSGKGGQG